MMRSGYILSLLALMTLLVMGCKKKQAVVEEPEVNVEAPVEVVEEVPMIDSLCVEYQRTACFGACPIFTIKIYNSGLALYHGENFVDLMGDHRTMMDASTCSTILAKANEIGYFNMQERYDAMVSDLPSVITVIRDENGIMKRVDNRYRGPAELKELYELLDQIIDSASWNMNNQK